MQARAQRILVATLLALGPIAAGCQDDPQPITVMTRNLFQGADPTVLLSATTLADVESLTAGMWGQIQDSKFAERAVMFADEVARADPDVIALQEALLYRTQTPGDWIKGAAPNASAVDLDFLQMFLAALEARGLTYQVATSAATTDAELPARTPGGGTFDLRMTDRNAILIRDGLTFAEGPTGIFSAAFTSPLGGADGATLMVQRGYVSVDVTVAGKRVRVVNAHLEAGEQLGRVQEEQARQLLAALAPFDGPLILAGDFESPGDGSGTQTYALLTDREAKPSALRDVWEFRHAAPTVLPPSQNRAGLPGTIVPADGTCCLDLTTIAPSPRERVDLVLFRGGVHPVDATIVSTRKTSSGFWPSDHLGVSAILQLR